MPDGIFKNGTGIDYGTGDSGAGKFLPFNKEASAWWNPGESEWLFGGGASKDMMLKPPSADMQRPYLGSMLDRQAPMMDQTQQLQARQQQQGLAGMLQRQASGQQAGAGELAVNRQVGQAQAAQASQSMMARGANAGMANRQAARSTADIGVAGAGQAAQAQMQDQTNAMGQLGGVLQGMRGADVQVAGANQASQMQQQQVQLAALAQMLGIDQAEMQARIEKAKVDAGDKGNIGGIMTGLGTMMCDENLKTDVEPEGVEIDEMLRNIVPCSYNYKDKVHGEGRRVGVMAQDLQRTEIGESIVFDAGDHLEIDGNKAVPMLLAVVARLNARIDQLEGK